MNLSPMRIPGALTSLRLRVSLLLVVALGLIGAPRPAPAQQAASPIGAPSRLVDPVDEHFVVALKGNVRADVAAAPDLGPVEESLPLHLFLVLQRTPAQEADLENLIQRQQQRTAPEYHKWLTPKQFGARFGASPEDIARLNAWLQSHGFEVRSVLNNASMIDFAGTAAQVTAAFHTPLHYFNIHGGKYLANTRDPQIPAALAPVVAGIKGLTRIPPDMNHTTPRSASYDKDSHRWNLLNPTPADVAAPAWDAGGGSYYVTPQDLYTIYDVNPVFTGGNYAATSTVAVIEESDIEYGTVNGTTGVATGGDVVTFRNLFGVPGTLNMHVYHGYGTVTCNDPGIDPNNNGEDIEASLDAEWINATAPSANLVFMSCDDNPDDGIFSSLAALVDNSLSDAMSMSYGSSELNYVSSDYSFQDTLYGEAATNGQSIFVSAGDSGSDVKDQNTSGTATSGINVSALAAPTVTVTGGTDFSDFYDAGEGGPAQSTYWSSTNSAYYGDAISYVPEMSWNGSCASSMLAKYEGYSGAAYCATGNYTSGNVVGGSGGISTHYSVPAWQTGISGYSKSFHSQPDIAGFASDGPWGHALIFCDSNPAYGANDGCVSSVGLAGGTSFVAPYMAGTAGLLVTATGSRQGLLNPALYALGKAQYTSQPTECYSNGQTSNTGVTTGLPASTCIFNDITTSNNDVPCAAGATSCYVNSGMPYGMLSLTGSSSLTVAFPSTIGYDQVTGIGSVKVANLIKDWNTAFTSSTALTATPATITTTQSTELKATVTGGTPTGYVDTPPAVTGTATFKAGSTVVGSCTLSGGSCQTSVPGTAFQVGSNSVTATFGGSGTYPSSTSTIVTVTVTSGGGNTPSTLTSPANNSVLTGPSETFTWKSESGATGYILRLGTTPKGNNIYTSGTITATSATPTKLPTNGETVYGTLYTVYGTTQVYNSYTFTASTQAALTAPSNNSVLTGPSEKFTWSSSNGATGYILRLGTTPKGNNIYTSGTTTATSVTPTTLPTNGETVYGTLYTNYGSVQVYNSYTFTASTLAALTSPANNSVLTGTSETFTWSPSSGATGYILRLGTTPKGNDIYTSGTITGTSATPTKLPTNGETVYGTLYTVYGTVQLYNSYTFTAK